MRKAALLFLLLLFLAPLVACKKEPAAPADVLLRIDGRSVTLQAFRRDFERMLPVGQPGSAAERDALQRSFLAQTIDRRLALAEAERLGLEVSPAEVEAALAEHRRDYPDGGFEAHLRERQITLEEWKRDLEERLLLEKVAARAVGNQAEVGEAEIAAYYRANRDEFERPAQVRARQIVVESEADGEQVLTLLKQKVSFAEVARSRSLSPDAEVGGDLGFFARGEMPAEFDAVVFSLPVGKLSPLIKSEYGFHIFLVEERRDAGNLSLAQARDEIRAKLRAEQEERLYRQWLDALHTKAKIEVDWALLDKQ